MPPAPYKDIYHGNKVRIATSYTDNVEFSAEAGIHQGDVLKNPMTYEIMKPENF